MWLSDVGDRLEELGIGSTQVQSVLTSIDVSSLVDVVKAVLVDVSPDRG